MNHVDCTQGIGEVKTTISWHFRFSEVRDDFPHFCWKNQCFIMGISQPKRCMVSAFFNGLNGHVSPGDPIDLAAFGEEIDPSVITQSP